MARGAMIFTEPCDCSEPRRNCVHIQLTPRGERLMLVFCWLREQAPYMLAGVALVGVCSLVGLIDSLIN